MENNVQRQLITTFLFLFSLTVYLLQIAHVHSGTVSSPGASVCPITRQESLNTFDSAAPRTYRIICISSESCLGSIVGLPGSHVLLPYVPLYRLRWHRENYCDCVLILLDEHLGRESWKLTVMMRWELVSCLKGSKFLAIFSALCNKSVFIRLSIYSAPSLVFRIPGATPKFVSSNSYG